jgi:hypothetical protein
VKLKIDHNCLRLRLTADDLRELAAEGELAETTSIGGASLTYALEPGNGPAVTADFVDTRINVVVPRELLEKWASGDEIAIEASQPPLRILIEKDLGRGRGRTS